MVFSAYSFLIILISSGIPLAVSKMISSQNSTKARQKTMQGIVALLITISVGLAVALILSSKGLALLQGEAKIWVCYIILAPSIIFSAGSAILKGYCQGVRNFRLSALSNIFEQLIRVVFGLALMIVLSKFYILGALIGAMIGTLVGDISSFLFLKLGVGKKYRFKYLFSSISDGKEMFKYAYPIMLYSVLVPLSNFIDSFLVVKLLNINFMQSTSSLLYGLQSGVVGSIVSIPTIFSFALVSVLMPSLSGDFARGDIDKFNQKACMSFKLILFIVLPCTIFFAINSSNVINLLFSSRINGCGVNGQFVAKNLLIISSVGVVFSSISQISAVVLQNLNKSHLPIINLSIGLVCKIVIELMFVPSKNIGVYAYAIALVAGFVVSGVLNLYTVERYLGNLFGIKYITKQFGLSVLVLGLLTLFKLFNSTWVFILGSIFTVIIYLVGVYLIKLFSKKDINLIINNK